MGERINNMAVCLVLLDGMHSCSLDGLWCVLCDGVKDRVSFVWFLVVG